MKKLIATFAVLLAVSAQAEYMMWAVDAADLGDVNEEDVAYMRVGYVTEDGKQPCWSGHALTAYDLSPEPASTGGSDVQYVDGARFQVDLTSVKDYNYSFYIELLNSDHQVIGRSGNNSKFEYASYESLAEDGYIATGSLGTLPQADVWYGGGEFTACPEPSSMALLALGAGLVGLRRKLKKGKKAKKEIA